jgi:hypothetical protein
MKIGGIARSLLALAVCLLATGAPTTVRAQREAPGTRGAAPADPSAHRSAFVVHRGARLHYLDWGGSGPAVVLLPGYGLTAHAFDEIGALELPDFRGGC